MHTLVCARRRRPRGACRPPVVCRTRARVSPRAACPPKNVARASNFDRIAALLLPQANCVKTLNNQGRSGPKGVQKAPLRDCETPAAAGACQAPGASSRARCRARCRAAPATLSSGPWSTRVQTYVAPVPTVPLATPGPRPPANDGLPASSCFPHRQLAPCALEHLLTRVSSPETYLRHPRAPSAAAARARGDTAARRATAAQLPPPHVHARGPRRHRQPAAGRAAPARSRRQRTR